MTSYAHIKHPFCYTGESDGYGYAFVPGNNNGIVLLDLRSKELLENPSIFKNGADEQRLELLAKKGLLIKQGEKINSGCSLVNSPIRTFGTWLHVTNACNLSCPYCYIKKDYTSMSIETAKAYLNKLELLVVKYNIKSLDIRFAGGEPTLQKDLIQTITQEMDLRFTSKDVKYTLTLITNGVLLNRSWLAFIKANGIRICISLDGINEWHDKLRFLDNGKGTFEIIWPNIKLCQEEGLNTSILTTVTEQNLEGLEELNKLLVDTNLTFRYGVYRDTNGKYQDYQDFIKKLSIVLRNCYDYYANNIRKGEATFKHQLADIRIDNHRHLRCCSSGHSGISVKHDGTIYLCQSRMNANYIGTVFDHQDFFEMIKNQSSVPSLRNKDVRDYQHCGHCKWALTCGGGCPVVNLDTYGTIATASPYCDLFTEFIPRLIDLKALSLIKALQRRKEVK